MTDDATPDASGSPDVPAEPPRSVCPWCSAALPAADAAACPSCGATLIEAPTEDEVPGVTTLHPEYAARLARAARAKDVAQRRGLLGWLAGDIDEDGGETGAEPAPEGAFDLPAEDVRREMLRLEMEALLREAEAEAAALSAERGAGPDAADAGTDDAASIEDLDPSTLAGTDDGDRPA